MHRILNYTFYKTILCCSFALAMLFTASALQAQVSYDNNGIVSGGSKFITVPSGYNRLLVVHASTFGGNRSASFNGIPMTEVITKTASGWVGRTTIFILPLGTGCEITAKVTVSSGGAGGGYARIFWAGSFQHVDQTTPIADKGSAAFPGGHTTSTIGGLSNVPGMDIIFDGLCMGKNGSNPPEPTPNGGGVVLYNNAFSFNTSRSVARFRGGSGSNATASWTVAIGWDKPHVAVVLNGIAQDNYPLDTEAPIALCQDATVALDGNGTATITKNQIDNGSSDDCSIASMTLSESSFDCTNLGTNNVTLTVMDGIGASSTCDAVVTIEDNDAPTASCVNPITLLLDANEQVSITADQLDGGSTDNCGIINRQISRSSFDCNDLGNTTNVTLTVMDATGNSSNCDVAVTIENQTPPNALCKDMIVQLDANGSASITTTDIDDGSYALCASPTLSLDINDFTCDNVGENDVTLTATDISGNTSTCEAIVTVESTTPPTANCTDVIIDFGNSNGIINLDLNASDVNNGSTVVCGDPILSLFPSSFTLDCNNFSDPQTTTLTVTDENGNSSTCTANVYGIDNTPPSATCQNITIALDDNGNASITESTIDNGSSDVCGITNYDTDITSFDCNKLGNNTLTLTVSDAAGNTSSCTANVLVEDNIAPTAICLTTTVTLQPNGSYSVVEADVYDAINSFDNCAISNVSFPATAYTCDEADNSYMVPVTIKDASGNTDQCYAELTVKIGTTLPLDWNTSDIGNITIGNAYDYDPCVLNGTFTITGSGNNAIGSVNDHIAFAHQSLCGDGSITTKIESVTPNGYGGLMIRENTSPGAKQTAIFSNLSNILRHEVRYTANGAKQVNSFYKPSPIWLKLERQGDWIFTYYSSTGYNFQIVHSVFLPMQSCVEIGLASFTNMPYAQTSSVFNNTSITEAHGTLTNHKGALHTNELHKTSAQESHQLSGPYTAAVEPTELNVYPNPANDAFTLLFNQPIEQATRLELHNSVGQLVDDQWVQAGSTSLQWTISHLSVGIYWISIPREATRIPLVITRL
ncbi:MAG: T9SS type A sorting domain-containing protein [Chitinophagales bacterium]|nr:T9SS type A sorting domain-containing protein [Chitinophagales bacterium]